MILVRKFSFWAKVLLLIASLLISISGMLQVTFSFGFFSDEEHLFGDSLQMVDKEIAKSYVKIESIYSDYLKEHYRVPDHGPHPNGVVLILGPVLWFLNMFKELTPRNIIFFVISIRFLLAGAVLLSLYFLYLLCREIDEIKGKRIGLMAVAIVAIFPPLIAYGSIRAMDTLSLLFLMISLWSFARLIRSEDSSYLMWIIPGIATGVFLILKKSGFLIIPVLVLYSLLLSKKWDWRDICKKLIVTIGISIVVIVLTNNPFLYMGDLLWPSMGEESLSGSPGINKFGLFGFQVAKLWELIHPDYYHYLGYHRHAGPDIEIIGLINKFFTLSFFILWLLAFVVLLVVKRWREAFLLNLPFLILFLSLPSFKTYRFMPVFPLFLSTIAFGGIALWDKYANLRYRLGMAIVILLLFISTPLLSILGRQVVNGETYLDLGEIAIKNRHLQFRRGIFYDRKLYQWKVDRLGYPFVLIPGREGLMKEEISFKKAGIYEADFLIKIEVKDSNNLPEIRVKLGKKTGRIIPTPDTLSWYSFPLSVDKDHLIQDLIIDFRGINLLNDKSVVGLCDIRVAEIDKAKLNEWSEYMPSMPWWERR